MSRSRKRFKSNSRAAQRPSVRREDATLREQLEDPQGDFAAERVMLGELLYALIDAGTAPSEALRRVYGGES